MIKMAFICMCIYTYIEAMILCENDKITILSKLHEDETDTNADRIFISFDFYLFFSSFKSHDLFMFQINWFEILIHFDFITSTQQRPFIYVWNMPESKISKNQQTNKQYVQLLKVNKTIWKNNIKILHRHEIGHSHSTQFSC